LGLRFGYCQSPAFVRCVLTSNSGYAATLWNCSGAISLEGTTGSSNGNNAIYLCLCTVDADVRLPSNGLAYVVSWQLTVQPGVTLAVDPGAVVKFEYSSDHIDVLGTIDARGLPGSEIYFTSFKDDTVGGDTNADGDATTPRGGNWSGIRISGEGSRGLFDHCVVRYGGSDWSPNVACLEGGALLASNTTVAHSRGRGFYCGGASIAQIIGCTLRDCCFGGATFENCQSPTLSACVIAGNPYGSAGFGNCQSPVLSDNSFTNNAYGPVLYECTGELSIGGNSGAGNSQNAIYVEDCTVDADSRWQVNEGLTYVVEQTLEIGEGATLTLDPGVVIKMRDSGSALWVFGTLRAEGEPGSEIYFTSYRDDTVGADTNGDGNATSPAPGDWGAIGVFRTSSLAHLDHCVIRYGRGGDYATVTCLGDGALEMANCAVSLSNSRGIYCETSSSVEIVASTISDNASDGIYLLRCPAATIGRCRVIGNVRDGLSISQGTDACVYSSAFVCNGRSGVRVSGSSPHTILLNTMAWNAQGIDATGTGHIAVDNIAAFNDVGVQAASADAIDLGHNCVFGNVTDYSGVDEGATDIHEDPRFADELTRNVRLQLGSPCIDAGDDSVVEAGWLDIEGDDRIIGDAVDIGADEHTGIVVSGRALLNDYVGPEIPTVRFELRDRGETDPFEWSTAELGPDGSFVISAPVREFDLSLRTRFWLRRTAQLDTTFGSVADVLFDLVNGDLTGDNNVDLRDVCRVLTRFEKADAGADVDGDGGVSWADLTIVLTNFGLAGDL
jgi:hypothetical protein